jgi:exoribonuclease R
MQWSDSLNKPIGQIVQNIGPVDDLNNFYEYQLYCKSLNASIQKLTKDTLASIKTNTSNIDKIKEQYQLEERTDVSIFSIDPQGSVDFDDAFSIKEVADNAGDYILSIYISNVTIWLDYLNLWPSMSNRISTIYLPDRKRPMLPTVLSDCLCSLQEKEKRFALTMDLYIYFDFASSSMVVREIKYSNTIIQVNKNYVYDEPDLLTNIHYKQLKEVVAALNKNPASKYTGYIKDSHDVVEYLMVLMNHRCAQKLVDKGEGIFRCITSTNTSTNTTTTKDTNDLPSDIANLAHIWASNSSGKYINVKNKLETESLCHQFLNLESYVHITSPIRRLVDLLNIIQFQLNFDFVLSEKASEFYQYWTSIEKISYINTTTKSIKKVQNDCNLLHLCTSDPAILEKLWSGYVFDIVEHNNGLFQYIIYIHELKIFGKIVLREKLDLYYKGQFKLFIFNNEAKMKKKIRLQYI